MGERRRERLALGADRALQQQRRRYCRIVGQRDGPVSYTHLTLPTRDLV